MSEGSSPHSSLKAQIEAAFGVDTKTKRDAAQQTVSVSEARRGARLRVPKSQRSSVRMLWVSSDASILEPGSTKQQHLADLAQFVGELHIMVLGVKKTDNPVERPMKQVWTYRVSGKSHWRLGWNAWQMAKQQLRFNGVSQPDVVIAEDPYDAGVAAWVAAHTLKRPLQVHVLDDIFSLAWYNEHKDRRRQRRLAQFVLRRVRSARTSTDAMAKRLKKKFRKLTDVAPLPHLMNVSTYRTPRADDIHDTYPDYRFIMLTVGEYSADSALHDVFASVHGLLKNQRIGLVVRGYGTAKHLFTEKAELLDITKQVVLLNAADDDSDTAVMHYQTADVFIETGTDTAADERVLQALAAGTAVVAYRTMLRDDLIEDGTSGYVCDPGDSFTLGTRVRRLLNDSALRKQFVRAAKRIATDQVHEDTATFYAAYRDSLVRAMVVDAS